MFVLMRLVIFVYSWKLCFITDIAVSFDVNIPKKNCNLKHDIYLPLAAALKNLCSEYK